MNKKRNTNREHLKIKRKIFLLVIIGTLLASSAYSVADLPPFPHYITGEATYDGTIPADGANVTVVNERTSEKLYDIVGPSGNSGTSGWFLVDLVNLQLGFQDGDNITVIINGTGNYSSWVGTNSTIVNTTTATQIVNVILTYDPIPPVTTKYIGEPKYGEYVTSHTGITLTAVDSLSGVNKTYYRIWYNGSWNPEPGTGEGIDNNFFIYTENFTLDGEGLHYIEFYSMDNAGNNETVHNQTHYVDDTPPTTIHSLSPPSPNGNNNWYTSLSITLNSTDDKSGVHTIFYNYNMGTYQEYIGPLTPPDGEYTLYYFSIDKLGNTENVKSVNFKLDQTPPTVSIVSGPSGTITTNTVTFEWSGSDNIGGLEYRYKLDGDWSGWTTDTSHTFTDLDEGDYIFKVEARDGAGNNDTEDRSFSITTNVKPVADADGPYTSDVGVTITFDASGSYDPDGSIVSYSWDFGDGSTGSGVKPTHAYTGQGTFTVTLTVTDNNGATDTDTTTAIIGANQPPVADFTYTPASPTDLDIINFVDTSTDEDGQIVNWTWHFGDGNISYEQSPNHKYVDNGTYSVMLRVKDDKGASNTIEKQIEIANVPPTATFTHQPDKPKVGEKITFSDISEDPDGSIVNWTWNFGDGNISYEQNPSHTYNQKGTYTITLTVKDNDGATDITSLEIKITEKKVSYILPIVALVILIIVAILVVIIWKRRYT